MFKLHKEDSSYKESHLSAQQVKFTTDVFCATQVWGPPPPGETLTHYQEQKSHPHPPQLSHAWAPHPTSSLLSWQGALKFEKFPRAAHSTADPRQAVWGNNDQVASSHRKRQSHRLWGNKWAVGDHQPGRDVPEREQGGCPPPLSPTTKSICT